MRKIDSGPAIREQSGATVRAEEPRDAIAVDAVNQAAFGRADEGRLVAALRAAGAVTLSLVAEAGGAVVGHILFSGVTIATGGDELAAVGLGPMSVLPVYQGRGVGSLLVRAGLEEVRRRGYGAAVVLGHADYYPRFGFVRAREFGLRCEFGCPDEAFMALELRPGALAGRGGLVRYRPEFTSL